MSTKPMTIDVSFKAVRSKMAMNKLEKQVQILEEKQANIEPAYRKLMAAKIDIEASLEDLDIRSDKNQARCINQLEDLELGDDYTKNLKDSLVLIHDKGKKELNNLYDTTKKIIAQMIVVNEEASIQAGIVMAKIKVYQAGEVQLDFLKHLRAENDKVGESIKNLLAEAEQITRDIPLAIKSASSTIETVEEKVDATAKAARTSFLPPDKPLGYDPAQKEAARV